MNIYVGNLPWDATKEQVEELFSPFGQVDSVRIITDRETGRARGFAFVQMADKSEGQQAIDQLNGQELMGKQLRINEARPKENNFGGGPRRSGGGDRGDRGGNGGGFRRSRF